jgi:hypothetical protein
VSDVFQKPSVSSELAHRIVAAGEAKAADIGVPMNIAVRDESGVLKAPGPKRVGERGAEQLGWPADPHVLSS